MPRDPLALLPLLQFWMRCLGEDGKVNASIGDLGALPELDLATLFRAAQARRLSIVTRGKMILALPLR